MKNCKLNKGRDSGFNNNLKEWYFYNFETQKTMLHVKSNLGHWEIIFIKGESSE